MVSSVVPIESADKGCDNSKLEEVVEEATKLQEGEMVQITDASESFQLILD